MTEAYDPLEYSNLAKSVVEALLSAELMSLPPADFEGAGVYAIYYDGPLEYARSESPREVPLYVGKAVPTGARKGDARVDRSYGRTLHRRLRDHSGSIEQAENLHLGNAWCRYLVVVPVWIPLAESFLINHFRPLWNTALDGFGNHDPGRGRAASARPRWDIMHPGRPWAARLHANETPQEILADIPSAEGTNLAGP